MNTEERVITTAELLAGEPELGTRVYRMPPGELVLGRNVRVDVTPDPEMSASIRARGVLQPIVAYLHDGRVQVHMGQRRAYFAAAEGLPWVPVMLTVPPEDESRLFDQLVENAHRAPNTTADRAIAVQQLALIGIPAGEIVRRSALRRGDVDAALAVAASATARAVTVTHPDLNLAQAAAIAEFDDEPDVVEELTAAAGRGLFDHAVQRARDDRLSAAARARVAAELAAAGVTALERVDWSSTSTLQSLGITPAKHRDCPGHAAYLSQGNSYVHGRTEWTWRAEYVCTQRRVHAGGASGTLDAEAARQDRADVIAGNRAWRAAEQVRRRWLAEFARRTRPPAGAEQFIAAALLRRDDCLRRAIENHHELLRHLLEPDEAGPTTRIDEQLQGFLSPGASSKRALVLAAATLLAAWENTTDVHCWRSPTGGHRGVDRFYLGQLAAWGYELSDIERCVTDPEAATRGATS